MVEVQTGLRADGGLEQGTDLPDLHLQLPKKLDRPALGADHVPEDCPFGSSGDQRLRYVLDIDQRAASAATILLDGNEGHYPVRAHELAGTQRNQTIRHDLHVNNSNRAPTSQNRYIWRVPLVGRTKRLEGAYVELRRHARENYSLYAAWYGDSEVWHLTSWTSTPLNRSAVERMFDEREKSATDDSFAIYISGDRDPIGVISLMNVSETNASADLSVILGPSEKRNQGYGADAIRTLLDYAFGELELHRVGLSVFEFNEAAIATYEKLSFRKEGRYREAVKRDGVYYDAILMSILEPEWRESSSS